MEFEEEEIMTGEVHNSCIFDFGTSDILVVIYLLICAYLYLIFKLVAAVACLQNSSDNNQFIYSL